MERFVTIIIVLSGHSCCYRLVLACGGVALNSFEDLNHECLGKAGIVYEHVLVGVSMRSCDQLNRLVLV